MSEKVLLVDDEQEFTQVLATRLESRGVTVDTAENGLVALDKARERYYDAVVLDLAMPELDGIETLQRLLNENPDLQVIILTGRATVEKGVEAVKLGALEFLEKPVDIQQLMEKIYQAKGKKVVLVEKRQEERIRNILESRGW